MPNAATAVAAASSNLRTFGTKSGTAPTSAMKIAHDLMRSKGISGIYKGLGATLARYTNERYIDVLDNWMPKKESQFDLKCAICRAKFSCFDSSLLVSYFSAGTCHFPASTSPCLPIYGWRFVTNLTL